MVAGRRQPEKGGLRGPVLVYIDHPPIVHRDRRECPTLHMWISPTTHINVIRRILGCLIRSESFLFGGGSESVGGKRGRRSETGWYASVRG
jgi:hypothetical protein